MSTDLDQRAKARRIAENAGEEEESKKREKLQWMYAQKENDEDDYLMGKSVKDDLDFCRQEEKRVEDSFGSVYAQRDAASTLQVDMGAKLREDPMAYIKKNDDDAWRRIYENPVKMAQLRTILRPMMDKRKKKLVRAKKGEKGEKKTRSKARKEKAEKCDDAEGSSSSSSSSGESDDEVTQKSRTKRKSGDPSSSSSSSFRKNESTPSTVPGFSVSSRNYGLEDRNSDRRHAGNNDNDDDDDNNAGARSSSPSSSSNNGERTYKFIERRKLENEKRKIMEGNHAAAVGASKDRGKKKALLSEEEMEEKRRQMMEDAKANNDERSGNIRKYKEDERRQVAEERASRDKAGHFSDSTQPDFVRPLVNGAYKSAEERIKRNINSVQRSRADQDKNFTKR